MGNLLQVYYVVLPNVQLLDVLAVRQVPQRAYAVVRQGHRLQALHLLHECYTVDFLAPHVDILN